MQTLVCECGDYLYLTFEDYLMEQETKQIVFNDCPLLKCPACQKVYLPDGTKPGIKQALENAKDRNDNPVIYPTVLHRFMGDYITTEVEFLFDKRDYYLIPGLWRPFNTGFLTPVFLNIEALLKYAYHPCYAIELGANTYGSIYKDEEHLITFGINRNGKVLMWLGDIAGLAIEEQYYLRSENVESDHDIASEFYEGQIEVQWAEPSSLNLLFKRRLDFHECSLRDYKVAISQLLPETIRAAAKIIRPIVDTERAFMEIIIPLNMVCVESINNKALKQDLKAIDPEMDTGKIGSLKLFQLWIEKRLCIKDHAIIVSPLFVLYDLRVASAHLQSDESANKIFSSCCSRLNLPEDSRDYLLIFDTLINKLNEMYAALLNAIE